MAFQFVPNADGSFTEGDKQTNPETNQEYIFTDGAWRPLGIEVATDLTELDKRYLQLSGGTLTNRLFFDRGSGGHNFLISPNSSDTSTSMYAMNSGALRLRTIPGDNVDSGSTTHIGIGKADDGSPETYIYHLQDPQEDLWAANKQYVDQQVANVDLSAYLPLTGGELSGNLAIKSSGSYLFFRKDDGTNQFQINPNSSDYFTNIYAYAGAGVRFRVSQDNGTSTYGTPLVMKAGSQTIDGTDYDYITEINYVKTPTNKAHAVNKHYVDTATKQIPPGLRYRYRSQINVNSGQITYYDDGGIKLRLSNTSRDLTWNNNGPVDDVSYSEGHMFTIYYIGNSGNWNIIRQGTINRIDWHSNDILCYVSSHQTNGSFSTDRDYYVTIAGIC